MRTTRITHILPGLFPALLLLCAVLFSTSPAQAEGPRVLVVSGHPDSKNSIATKTIMEEIGRALPGAELLYLDTAYPDFKIDTDKERQRVRDADIIVLQYPIYWYTPPAIMKRWQEEVFAFGFAHDAKGGLLGGKKLVLSMTSGAPESHYHLGGRMNYPMEMFQIPLQQFANLCGMEFAGMVYTGGYNLGRRETERDKQMEQAKAHARKLVEKIRELAGAAAADGPAAPAGQAMPLVRMAYIELKPEMREAFLVAVTENMRESLKKEPGVLALYCVAAKDNPNKLTFFEMYKDDAAYEAHRNMPHFKKYIETTKDMAVSKELVETAPVELRDQHNTPHEY